MSDNSKKLSWKTTRDDLQRALELWDKAEVQANDAVGPCGTTEKVVLAPPLKSELQKLFEEIKGKIDALSKDPAE